MGAKNFQACLDVVLRFEGGKVNNPKDPGGKTNQGITQATYDNFRLVRGLPKKDVYEMTAAERNAVYRDNYWDVLRCDLLPDGLDLAVFDFAVHSGPGRASLALEKVRGSPVIVATKAVFKIRRSFLERLRTWSLFKRGWLRRIKECEAIALRMVK
jgi:lysozyme family protein